MKRVALAVATALTLLLTACGGGGSGEKHPLPIDDASPHAYTLNYLKSHPEKAVQPEHLLVVPIDPTLPGGGTESVDMLVSRAMNLSLAIERQPSVLSRIAIVDAGGREVLSHIAGGDVASATLQPGLHRIFLTPKPASAGGHSQTVYLKLADTDAQAARRMQALKSSSQEGLQAVQSTALGAAATDSCIGCSFANSDLSLLSLASQTLSSSVFNGAKLDGTNFTGTSCAQCQFVGVSSSGTIFRDSNLTGSAFSPSGVLKLGKFNGAILDQAKLSGGFLECDFSPSVTTGAHTRMQGTDLTKVSLEMLNSVGSLKQVDFTGAKLGLNTFYAETYSATILNPMFQGARFDLVTPANAFAGSYFKGMDLSGVSFEGVDLSTTDLSTTNRVQLSATTDLSKAILSNGVSGVNLSGQNAAFPTPFVAWAGTTSDATSGRDLRFVNLSNINLTKADLTRANLSGAQLVGTNLSLANLYAVQFKGAQLGVAPGTGTQGAADLTNAYMPLADLTDADLRSVSLQGTHLYGVDGTLVKFVRSRLDSASFTSALLMDADFTQASLNDSDFTGAALINANFDAATLVNTKFNASILYGADFSSPASLAGIKLNNALIVGLAAPKNNYPLTENNGISMQFAYRETLLGTIATTRNAVCPSGDMGPCSTSATLTPVTAPAYPVPPKCIALRIYGYANCDPGWTPPSP